jgi:ergothioneine biosynthesis protein EgtB
MTLLDQYHSVRKHTEQLCSLLHPEDFVPQPVSFVSPPKWHLAHSTWFFEEFILKKYLAGYTVFNEDFSFLFNSYYNNVGKRVLRENRGAITRPATATIMKYRDYVDLHMELLLQMKAEKTDFHDLTEMGINHEQQHQELLMTDIKYIFSCNPISPVYSDEVEWENQQNESEGFLTIPEGVYGIGFEDNGFCFDNELAPHKVYLQPFEIENALVTNAQYLEFMEAGGYENFNYWLDEGWRWVNENKINSPLYWHKADGKWQHYTLAGMQNIHPNAIVTHVSFYEAAAYAEWKKMRLPTEFEWEIAAPGLDWGKRWEWTHSAYLPYPGFRKTEGAVGEYNGKFMINQMVLRGGSCATSPHHSRTTYRNFFHPEERWQFNGIRLAKL